MRPWESFVLASLYPSPPHHFFFRGENLGPDGKKRLPKGSHAVGSETSSDTVSERSALCSGHLSTMLLAERASGQWVSI